MATVTDTLETVLTLNGANTVLSGLASMASSLLNTAVATESAGKAQKELDLAITTLLTPLTLQATALTKNVTYLIQNIAGFAGLAASEGLAAAATITLEAALAVLEAPLVLIAAGLAALTAGLVVAGASLAKFSEQQQQLVNMAVIFRNLGRAAEVPGLDQFAGQIATITGVTRGSVVELEGLLARFKLTGPEIEKAVPTIIDFAKATGIDVPKAADLVASALRGEKDAIQAFGVDLKVTGDHGKDLTSILDQLNERYKGGAKAAASTLPGALDGLAARFNDLLAAIGRLFGPALVPLVNFVSSVIADLTTLLNRLAQFAERVGFLKPVTGDTLKIGTTGDPKQTALLGKIADNTASTSDALVKAVLGGPGTIAKGAATARDFRLAFA